MLIASLDEFIVFLLFVPHVLNVLANEFRGSGIIFRVEVVWEPGVILRKLSVMDGEGNVDAVGGLAKLVDVLAGLRFSELLVEFGTIRGTIGGRVVGFGIVFGTEKVDRRSCGGRGHEEGGEADGCSGRCGRAVFSSFHYHDFALLDE